MTRGAMTEAGGKSPRGILLFGVAMVLVASCGWAAEEPSIPQTVSLTIQTRDGTGKPVQEPMSIAPKKTAVVVIDMWDRHWCQTYTARVANMVPRMNRTLESARKLGIQVVFAPSDVVGFYEDFPQRRAMLGVPSHPLPERRSRGASASWPAPSGRRTAPVPSRPT